MQGRHKEKIIIFSFIHSKNNMYYIPGYIYIYKNMDNSLSLKNTYTKKEILMDNEYLDVVSKILHDGVNILDDDVSKFLHENGFIQNEKEFIETIHDYYDVNDNYLRFIFMPTEGCNFRCTYCYENHENTSKKLDYDAIAQFMQEKVNERNWDKIILNWFGGEPLLKIREIKDFSEKVKPILDGKDVVINIVTNGYNLNEEIIQILEEADVLHYQITIDGDMHDTTRILANGKPTRQIIMNNLKSLKKHEFKSCEIRVNVTDYSSDNNLFYKELFRVIGCDKRFSLDIHKVFESDKFKLDSIDKMDNIYQENMKSANSYGLNIERDRETILQCYGAQKNCYTFRPNQTIVKCTVALDEGWNQIGEIKNHSVIIFEKNGTDCLMNLKPCLRCSNIRNCKRIVCSKEANDIGSCHYAEKNTFDNEQCH